MVAPARSARSENMRTASAAPLLRRGSPTSGGRSERRDDEHLLAVDAERLPARGQHPDVGRGAGDAVDDRAPSRRARARSCRRRAAPSARRASRRCGRRRPPRSVVTRRACRGTPPRPPSRSVTRLRSTNQRLAVGCRANSMARRVFPTPAGPASVTSRERSTAPFEARRGRRRGRRTGRPAAAGCRCGRSSAVRGGGTERTATCGSGVATASTVQVPGHALQRVAAPLDELDAGARDQVADARGDEHLAGLAERDQARRDRDAETGDVVAAPLDLARVHARRGCAMPSSARRSRAASAARSARAGPSNTASTPSPVDLTQRPCHCSTSVADDPVVAVEQRRSSGRRPWRRSCRSTRRCR